MPFGLKNAGATYKRLIDKAFDSQISQNIEVYVDELVVKSYTKAKMLRDIDETFCTLRKINMKLNPKKYTFGVAEGVFLGYVVIPNGIKLCLDKTADVLQLPSSQTIKEFQGLYGKLASTAEAEQAFKQLKQHLSKLPLLVAPKPKEELIIYLSAIYGDISAVLMTERGATHTPIYFIIPALQGPKLNYTPMEKQVLSQSSQPRDFGDENPQAASIAETQQEAWTLFTDGSLRMDGFGVGLILTNPERIEFTYVLRF
uniref:Reverse transcriptase domain-containing protein n=1 Tax=Tanacetum cinerariifolium TaxID=118510 RepID=A0A699L0U8_TANCI|nr:reverse transcriptase domain-containing protein [Tanacetum cinerariifolium]